MDTGASAEDSREVAKKIGAALNNDVRIGNVKLPSPENSSTWSFTPFRDWKPEDLANKPTSALTVQFEHPISFTVHVPAKNQKFDRDDLPEDHLVRWDGATLLIAWHQSPDAAPPPGAGIIVRDVLREALEAGGFHVTVQPPTPAYSVMQIMARSTDESITFAGVSLIAVEVPRSWDTEQIVDSVFDRISFIQTIFYGMANQHSLVREIGFSMERDLDALLRIQHQRVAPMSWRSSEYWKRRWQLRLWRRETRQIIARIWLAMSQLRLFKVAFSDSLTIYERFLGEGGEPNLFQREQEEMVREEKNLDLTFAERRAEEIGSRLDNRELVAVTLIAAIVAVVIGAIATAWLAHFFGGLTSH